ncbi:lantibiotic dehydratase C-terminal domain-containing protein [Desmospora activa]|uniref:Lantibiotic biosynthesis dehydratase-like protein n=1 Tax=Desmospora activa DSM 45169 TaxID=1121389 RepID=A0A2T4Z7X7_9BACL|nr:lantibiotic dehydratase C-terminal domain-containing protein [Desmospora activa]PTM57990.1 lantibiotic biosynthesis dehydratase-like protein [Desmospora activa DSM 45169]
MKLQSIKIYMYDYSSHDNFIREKLIPLNQSVHVRSFLRRGWKYGPHLEWCMKQEDQSLENLIQELSKCLTKYKVDSEFDETSWLHRSQHLKLFELDKEEIIEIREDLTLEISIPRFRTDIWGEKGTQLLIKYYLGTGEAMWNMLNNDINRFTKAISMMYSATKVLGDPDRHQLSYRSHAEAFLYRFDKNDVIRNQMEEQYQLNKYEMTKIMKGIEENRWVSQWCYIFDELLVNAHQLFEQKELKMPDGDLFMKIVGEHGWKTGSANIPGYFHQFLLSLPRYNQETQTLSFQVKRLILNFLYQSFVQLGITPVEKFFMCYSYARWYEDELGVDWKSQLTSLYG